MEFVDQLLEEDIRNNSAWNQRHFVVVNTTSYTPEVLAAEVEYAKTAIKKAVHNESPWNYLRGILMQELDQSESPMYRYPGEQILCDVWYCDAVWFDCGKLRTVMCCLFSELQESKSSSPN